MIVEPWLQTLKDGVDAGLWSPDDVPEVLEPLPQWGALSTAPDLKVWRLNVRPLDLTLAERGFLESPDGKSAVLVPGLSCLAVAFACWDGKAYWADLVNEHAGDTSVFRLQSRRLYVSPDVFDHPNWLLRYLSEYLGMIALGKVDYEAARAWAKRAYGPLAGWK